jgi:predicted amidohydrolase YtcJ
MGVNVVLLAALLLLPSPEQPPADLVVRGGAVYTMDAARSWAQAVAVRAGTIAFVGTDAGVASWIGPKTRVVDLKGEMVLPSFEDAHIHALDGGIELGRCDLHDLETKEAILKRVRSCAEARPGSAFLVGTGWVLSAFPQGIPTKEALDAVVSDRPAYFDSTDGHSAWVNSRALELAGITAATPDPKNGRIERDPKTGTPTGTLQEEAMGLVSRLIPPPSTEERKAGLVRALELLNRHGITAFQMPLAVATPPRSREALETLRDAEGQGTLNAKVVLALESDPARGPEQVDDLVKLRSEFGSARIRPTAVKIFEDGIIETHTAAMLEPYLDHPGDRGEPIWPATALDPFVARLARDGFSVHVHAIGDRAVRLALDAFEGAQKAPAPRPLRHQIAHLEVVDPRDIPRFAQLGVIANFQPLWAFPDPYITELTWPALGPERSRLLYPIRSVARAGGTIAFGSDWSVSSLNPLEGIQVAVTRQSPGTPGAVLLPEEALDLPAALAAYTIGSAYANGLEHETGSIEVGKAGDLVVLSANLFTIPVHEIARCRVLLTLLDGKPVYRDSSFRW